MNAGPAGATGGRSSGAAGTGGAAVVNVPAPPPARCQPPSGHKGAPTLRRLTRSEYDHTVADLLGDRSSPASSFPPEQVVLGFDNNADAAPASTLLIEQAEGAAERLARQAMQDPMKFLGCSPDVDDCVRGFITTFGLRAFRRPLADDEKERWMTFHATAKGKYGAATSVRLILQAILQSPPFLYRVEGPVAGAEATPASPYEIASRLSYLLWSSMPDDGLFAAAKADALRTPEQITAQARRMLGDPRAQQGLLGFFDQWLALARVETIQKDAATYPRWSAEIGALMHKETQTFLTEAVLTGDGTLKTILTAPHTDLNATLAAFYGVTGPKGAAFEKVALDPKRRAGILTQGSFLASAAAPRQSSPVARGVWVLNHLLCTPPPPPPANVKAEFPEPAPNVSTRERLAAHRANPTCASCHGVMDPIGLGFEHYDGIAQWRDMDGGKPVNATGAINGTTDADGPFDGAIELSQRLANSKQTAACMARNYFRYAYARAETDADACTLQTLTDALAGDAGSIPRLILTLTTADPFLYRDGGTL